MYHVPLQVIQGGIDSSKVCLLAQKFNTFSFVLSNNSNFLLKEAYHL